MLTRSHPRLGEGTTPTSTTWIATTAHHDDGSLPALHDTDASQESRKQQLQRFRSEHGRAKVAADLALVKWREGFDIALSVATIDD